MLGEAGHVLYQKMDLVPHPQLLGLKILGEFASLVYYSGRMPTSVIAGDDLKAPEYLSIYIPWPFAPVWGVTDNTKNKEKQWGFYSVLLAMTRDPVEFGRYCWSNTAHPPPSSTTFVAS